MKSAISEEKKLANIIRSQVAAVLRDIFDDADYGLPAGKKFATKLKKSIGAAKKGKVKLLDEVMKKYQS
ncbi:hypothetical protein C4572_03095 [Candidatus Parcubacteria bacterium]|nr:MAG: hypothetical protein C4572_03095 [Candidatus Parcubacteria bacterium]